ncbi:MAG: hypothetical protein D6815_10635 [Candidatus Dadabacteria bacterium]|nr:MAG: hypothetical protein D6815_10635 [Candidatus Dadabacteria bacterium]
MLHCRPLAARSRILEKLGLSPRSYALMTLHRPSNVDDPAALSQIVTAIGLLQERLPIVFPVHPRTLARLDAAHLRATLESLSRVRMLPPTGYLDFLALEENARLILTDSGGIQEEAVVLEVPCVTLRDNTERPVTIESGWNRLAGNDPERILATATACLEETPGHSGIPPLWDGRAAERIERVLCGFF